ncbi:MAG TPA: hypothetical protein VEQ11_02825 [Chloroflexota bacterium]|nr:hypothetical protein [Chloroflexota bacterium]
MSHSPAPGRWTVTALAMLIALAAAGGEWGQAFGQTAGPVPTQPTTPPARATPLPPPPAPPTTVPRVEPSIAAAPEAPAELPPTPSAPTQSASVTAPGMQSERAQTPTAPPAPELTLGAPAAEPVERPAAKSDGSPFDGAARAGGGPALLRELVGVALLSVVGAGAAAVAALAGMMALRR